MDLRTRYSVAASAASLLIVATALRPDFTSSYYLIIYATAMLLLAAWAGNTMRVQHRRLGNHLGILTAEMQEIKLKKTRRQTEELRSCLNSQLWAPHSTPLWPTAAFSAFLSSFGLSLFLAALEIKGSAPVCLFALVLFFVSTYGSMILMQSHPHNLNASTLSANISALVDGVTARPSGFWEEYYSGLNREDEPAIGT